MRSCRFAPVLLAVAMLFSRAAEAGLADPPPTLAGQSSFHLWSVPGVVNNSHVTVFACSNATSSTIRGGVETFGPAGGASLNDASATSLTLAPSGTAMIGTQALAGFSVDSALNIGIVHKGSARVLATAGSGIICSAFLANPTTGAAEVNLTIVNRNSQTASSSSAFGTTVLAGLLLATGATAAMMMRRGSAG